MSPELLQWISRLTPYVGAVLVIGVGISLLLTRNRISPGSMSAGPRDIETPTVPGLTESAWNLTALDRMVEHDPAWILQTLRAEATRLGVPAGDLNGRPDAVETDIEVMLDRLERHLGPLQSPTGATS